MLKRHESSPPAVLRLQHRELLLELLRSAEAQLAYLYRAVGRLGRTPVRHAEPIMRLPAEQRAEFRGALVVELRREQICTPRALSVSGEASCLRQSDGCARTGVLLLPHVAAVVGGSLRQPPAIGRAQAARVEDPTVGDHTRAGGAGQRHDVAGHEILEATVGCDAIVALRVDV